MFARILQGGILVCVPAVSFAATAPTPQEDYLAVYLEINDAEHLEKDRDYAGGFGVQGPLGVDQEYRGA